MVIVAALILSFPVGYFWKRLAKGRNPPRSTVVLSQMEKHGVPDFELPRLDGTMERLSTIQHKLIVVNFWASWCAPCVQEFPSLKRLVQKLPKNVVVLAVSNDNTREDLESFLSAFGPMPKNFIVLWDKDRSIAKEFGTDELPESYIIAPGLKLVRKVAGVDQWDSSDAMAFFHDLIKTSL